MHKKKDFKMLLVFLAFITTSVILMTYINSHINDFADGLDPPVEETEQVEAIQLKLLPIAGERDMSQYQNHFVHVGNMVESNLTIVTYDYENSSNIRERITEAARRNNVDSKTAVRIAICESSLNPSAKNSTSSATGLYQFTDGTWEWIGSPGDRFNADDSIAAFMIWYPVYPSWWICQ